MIDRCGFPGGVCVVMEPVPIVEQRVKLRRILCNALFVSENSTALTKTFALTRPGPGEMARARAVRNTRALMFVGSRCRPLRPLTEVPEEHVHQAFWFVLGV